jgi:drug/metabolite transporter (DMT)-like permease
MLGGAVSFALMGAFTHALGSRCDWVFVAVVRTVVMLGSAVAMAWVAGVRLVVWRPPTLWTRSLAGSCSLVFNFYALARLPVADAITLSNLYPLWIVLATALVLRQPLTLGETLGVLSGIAGVVMIERPHLEGDRLAVVAAIGSSVSTAVAMFGLHRLRNIDSRAVVAHFAAVGTVVAGVWVLVRPWSGWQIVVNPLTLSLLLGVGISGTIGQVCLTRAYASGAPTRVSVFGLSQVVFAMSLDVLFWNRSFSPSTLLGFLLVLTPAAWLIGQSRIKLGTNPEFGRRGDPTPCQSETVAS